MSLRARWLTAALFILALGATLAVAAILTTDREPAWLAARWPIDLGKPLGAMADWRLRALQSDRGLCRLVLKAPHAETVEVSDSAGNGTDANGCGWTNSVRLAAVGSTRIAVDKVTCELTAATALWVAHEVQPAAMAIFGEPVASLRHLGGYACRNIRGNAAHAHIISEHARANALDIAVFVLASGRPVSVHKDWGKAGDEGRFLAQVHAGACRYFRVAIGPAYNAAHRDHFHYDRGRYRACR